MLSSNLLLKSLEQKVNFNALRLYENLYVRFKINPLRVLMIIEIKVFCDLNVFIYLVMLSVK